ncbi:MAG: OOP family OmpA-OmpF porin [Flavobacteriales bacterium]|jgi:OOP family OmpA-OmpF porin
MKGISSIFFLLCFSLLGWSQNLIPNHSFELYDTCPDSFGDFENLEYWFKTNVGSPDLFCDCYPTNSIPSSLELKKPSNGNCLSGMLLIDETSTIMQALESIAVELNQPLEINERYCFTMDVVSSSKVRYVVKNLNLGLDDKSLVSSSPVVTSPDRILNLSNDIIYDTTNWVSLKTEFIAYGTEKYIYIYIYIYI